LTQITEHKNVTAAKLLHMPEKNINYKKKDKSIVNFAEERKAGKLTSNEIMNKLIHE